MKLHIDIILYSTFSSDFLGPYMRTFDDISHVLIFIQHFDLLELLEQV